MTEPTNTEKKRLEVEITRLSNPQDAAGVLQIEHPGKEFTTEDFINHYNKFRGLYKVAKCGDRVVGYVFYDPQASRLEVLDIRVAPDCMRQSIGRQLIENLADHASGSVKYITAYVSEYNQDAIDFFSSLGFKGSRVRHRPDEDSYEMIFDRSKYLAHKLQQGSCVVNSGRQL